MELAFKHNYQGRIPPNEYNEGTSSERLRKLITIGFGKFPLSEVLGKGSFIETNYPNVETLIYHLPKLAASQQPDAILCCDSLSDNEINKLVNHLHNSVAFQFLPTVLLTYQLTIKTRKDVFSVGLDDVFDTSIDKDLFYERIEVIRETKKRLLNYPEDQLKLSLANIDVNINVFKRLGDIIISTLMLLALSPLFIIVAILIKLESRGSVFYTAKRAGAGYKIFDFYKFRSMAQGSDQEMEKVMHLNQYDEGDNGNGVFYKIKGDPRVTKIGAFLRKTSIDELPQLINVLKGDMSLVGNRPLPLYEAQQLTRDNWVARFNAPAGITGLWQISKRGKAEMSEEERVELDVEYSRKHSFWYDLWILIRTVPVIFQEDDV